jgi:hypothetical protein
MLPDVRAVGKQNLTRHGEGPAARADRAARARSQGGCRQGGLPELTAAGRPEQMLAPALRLCTNVALP